MLLLSKPAFVLAFSSSVKSPYKTTSSTCLFSSSTKEESSTTISTNPNPLGVDRVSVCMGELCRCQGEDPDDPPGAEFILHELQNKNLAFTIEETVCLGACGMNAMVSVEYKDGSYDLVEGYEDTLQAIGLEPDLSSQMKPEEEEEEEIDDARNSITSESEFTIKEVQNETETEILPTSDVATKVQESVIESAINTNSAVPTISQKSASTAQKKDSITRKSTKQQQNNNQEMQHGAVERMRAASLQDEDDNETINPWMNMASYLAKKATDSIFKK